MASVTRPLHSNVSVYMPYDNCRSNFFSPKITAGTLQELQDDGLTVIRLLLRGACCWFVLLSSLLILRIAGAFSMLIRLRKMCKMGILIVLGRLIRHIPRLQPRGKKFQQLILLFLPNRRNPGGATQFHLAFCFVADNDEPKCIIK